MSSWHALDEEIARWRDAGRVAELWWRDDDAVDATAALDRLLGLQHQTGQPLALAVVPAQATSALAARLADEPDVDVLQHGYAHTNHAPPTDKKSELGPYRPAMVTLGELGTGWLALERLFGPRALPVLVPPWNRIAPALVPTLPEIGFCGLSTFGRHPRAEAVRGLRQVNTHVDLIDWKGHRGFVGTEAALATLVMALGAARSASEEPIGMLSHHLAMDEAGWDFLRSLLGRTRTMSGVEMRAAKRVFASREARA
ncbi:MAG: polysaccharide deacetylase family protein [Alphaproteobacteria bacterium]|nr:polysaccharide deacetylase family protein [Alphaproteobacteria bacterium]